MAFVIGGKHFGQYTYEHWFDDEYKMEAHLDFGNSVKVILENFRLVDEEMDIVGGVIIVNGVISQVVSGDTPLNSKDGATIIIDGACLLREENNSSPKKLPVLMPAFVDLHAHFREPAQTKNSFPAERTPQSEAPLLSEEVFPSETIESASMAAAAGGFGTVVCMANTKPATDTLEKAAAIKNRSDALGLIDLYPVISLTKGMEGKELSEIKDPDFKTKGPYIPPFLSEDGKDLENEELFLAAMLEAKRLEIPISFHCDFGGEESTAVNRVVELGKKAGCHIHIAHVSTKKSLEVIRSGKKAGLPLTCEVMPHNLCLTEEDAKKLGDKTWGRVNPPLRSEEDRQAMLKGLADGTIDAIATDHAPHTAAAKEAGAPGFSGFETAFASVYTKLIHRAGKSGLAAGNNTVSNIDLKKLSSLMSANPAKLLGLGQSRGRILPGYRADLVIIDTEAPWTINPAAFKSRGKNSAFSGRSLWGKILMTLHKGKVAFS